MTKKKSPKAPPALRRLFSKGLNSLLQTIISLLPTPPPPRCTCRGKRCLGCISREKSVSFLLRRNDTQEYRNLLKGCFVVVPEKAMKFDSFDYISRWKQSQIVRRSIATIMTQCPGNLICVGFDQMTENSDIVELLTSSPWEVLLKRVGDSLMIYLLENSLIFLPLAHGQLRQVSGLSIKPLCFDFKNNQKRPVNDLGFEKKLKRINEVDNYSSDPQASSPLESSPLLHSSSCIGCSRKQHIAQFNGKRSMEFLEGPTENNIASTSAENAGNGGHIPCDEHNSNGTVGPRKKRPRQWLYRRQRSLYSRTLSLGPCGEGAPYKFQALQTCSCCSAFQYLPNVNEEDCLNRWIMFYKMEDCSLAFPRTHIFNKLKPNFEGARALLNEIFGNCWNGNASGATPCSHRSNACQIKSKCMYHSLTKLLKTLIHNAKYLEISRLLDKHCPVPSFEKDSNETAYTTELTKRSFSECNHTSTSTYPNATHASKKRKILSKDILILEDNFQGDCDSGVGSSSQSMRHETRHEPVNLYSSHEQVTSFTWAVCRSIVPPDLLGDPPFMKKLRMNISRFIRLRRFENFSLKQCMHELKFSKFPLLNNKHSSCDLSAVLLSHPGRYEANRDNFGGAVECNKIDGTYLVKHKILKCWIKWIFSCFVIPLLQANFYVTEIEGGKQDMFYYRKSLWEKVISQTCLETQNFHQLNDISFRKIVNMKNRSFGYSNARLCPKGSGMRVLANLSAPSKIPLNALIPKIGNRYGTSTSRLKKTDHRMFKSVNSVLRNAHAILKGVQVKLPDKLGSSVFDYNDVYKRLVPFMSMLRNGGTSKFFIVVADVSTAFDSVNQNKLLDVVDTVLVDDEYMLRLSDKIFCTKKSLYVQQLLLSTPQCGQFQPGILVNQGLNINIEKKDIIFDLVEHIKHNILQLGGKFYLQSVGIPQGSIISSLLCSFYYGHMENHVIYPYLKEVYRSRAVEDLGKLHTDNTSTSNGNSIDDVDISKPEYLLMRLVDDYLYISTSKQQAIKFFSLLQKGFGDYNAFMNERKFGSNFHMNHMSTHNRVFVGQDGISFLKWSGLLINSSTLEIQADYSRYQDLHLRSTLTVDWKGETYRKLREKLCDYLRPKCHPIFYDANINSSAVVKLNIYQVFLLCGMKFHSYVSVLFNLRRLKIKSILESLEFSLKYMHKLIKKRNYSIFCSTSLQPIYKVEKREIQWLGLSAYIRVLKRKGSRYGNLLFYLESKLKSLRFNENLSPSLKYATDDIHSSVFWKIKY